jgi:hypothetical protein
VSATAATLTKLLAWRPGGYLRASGVLFGWLALRTAAQPALFIMVARSMGADGYGALIAVMALAGVFSFAGMGASAVLVRDGARQPERLPELTGDLLRMWLDLVGDARRADAGVRERADSDAQRSESPVAIRPSPNRPRKARSLQVCSDESSGNAPAHLLHLHLKRGPCMAQGWQSSLFFSPKKTEIVESARRDGNLPARCRLQVYRP